MNSGAARISWWVHTHSFTEVEGVLKSKTRCSTTPAGLIGHSLFVKRELRRIFRYRHRAA